MGRLKTAHFKLKGVIVLEKYSRRIADLEYSDLLLLHKKVNEFLKEVTEEYENIKKMEEENS